MRDTLPSLISTKSSKPGAYVPLEAHVTSGRPHFKGSFHMAAIVRALSIAAWLEIPPTICGAFYKLLTLSPSALSSPKWGRQ